MLILEYQENWATDFERIKDLLLNHLDITGIQVEHVGSTAVVEMAAKPIIDINIIHAELTDFERVKARLEEIGYYHNGDQGIAGREVFKRAESNNDSILDRIAHHLYACHLENEELKRHLLFRDHLRQSPNARMKYSQLKIELAKQAKQDKKVYAELKENQAKAFINACIKKQKTNGK